MKTILVRLGVDQVFGGWNALVDAKSGQLDYVPIPENDGTRFSRGLERKYKEFLPGLQQFSAHFDVDKVLVHEPSNSATSLGRHQARLRSKP